MKKRMIALLWSLCLLTAPALAVETGFPDVVGDEWFAPAVEAMAEKGVVTGVGGGLFAPYEPVTRASVIVALWRLEGCPDAEVGAPFTDTEPWFETAAAWAKGTGIASGYGNDLFCGRDAVTREQLACFLYRYAQYKGDPLANGALGLFNDAKSVSDWALDGVRHAVGIGILQGSDQGNIEPHTIANRAAFVTMLQRMLTPAAG